MRLWWDEITVTGPEGDEIPFDEFTAAGRRWWDGLYAGDPRTADGGISLLAPPGTRRGPRAVAGGGLTPEAGGRRRPPPKRPAPPPAPPARRTGAIADLWARLTGGARPPSGE
jgi:hypothetical protein